MSEHQGQIDPTNLSVLLRRWAEAVGLDLSGPWVWIGLGLAAAVIGGVLFYFKSYIGATADERARATVRKSTQVAEVEPTPEQPTTGAAPRPRQLPSDLADFTGRDEAIRELLARLRGDEAGAAVSAVGGMGGVGKSALAIHVAHRVAEHYPDGQLFIDLRGTKERPLTPAEAMAEVVRALKPEAQVPGDRVKAERLYRTTLAGKRVLVLFDDAENSAQVGTLVPEPPAAALITSRQPIVAPGVRRFNLDAMTPQESRALLREIVGDERASDEELGEIAELCFHLPLALRVAGSYLATHATWTAAKYAEALRANQLRLQVGDDPRLNVQAVLGLSAARLAADRRELAERWQLLSVFPAGFDFAAAATVGWDEDEAAARKGLGVLEARSLVLYDSERARYRLHDLMREVAGDAFGYGEEDTDAVADGRRLAGAAARHAEHYCRVLGKADDLYLKGGEGVLAGLALFDAERSNVEVGQRWAAGNAAEDDAAAELCSRYPDAGAHVLELRLHARDRIGWREAALAAARRIGERPAEGIHLGNLGNAFRELGETRRAIECHEQALKITEEFGDRRGEGNVLANLGSAYFVLGEIRRAIEFHEQALVISREIGDRRGEGQIVGNLGVAYRGLGERRRAIEHYELQLEIVREIGDRLGEGGALGNLGNAYSDLGEPRRAIEFYEQHLEIAGEIGDRRGEGDTLYNFAVALTEVGERTRAIELGERSLAIFSEIEDPRADTVRAALERWRAGE